MNNKQHKPLAANRPEQGFGLPLMRQDCDIGRLCFRDRKLVRHIAASRPKIHFSSLRNELTAPVQRFIEQRYHRAFDACINVTFPELVWISNQNRQVLAAVGIRPAAKETLFLEQYTDRPIEQLLHTDRKHVVEIGNLVSSNRSATIALFCSVALVLERRGVSHATATGTRFLEHSLKMLGMPLDRICPASPGQLTKNPDRWGRYYDTCPQVLAGSVNACAGHLRGALQVALSSFGNQPALTDGACS